MEKLLYKPLGKGFLAQAGPLYCVWLGSGGPGSSREIPGSMKEMQEGVGPKQSGQPPREPGALSVNTKEGGFWGRSVLAVGG